MIARPNAIIAVTPSADHSGLEGYAVKFSGGEAVLPTAIDDVVDGVILEGAETTGSDSIALNSGGLAGTVKVKLSSSPGTVAMGTRLEITVGGTWKADAGTAGTVAAVACESGTADELIEATLIGGGGTITLEESYNTSITSSYADPDLTVTGQVQDAAGNSLSGRFIVGLYFGAAANDGTPFDAGDLAADTGSVLVVEHTADSYAEILTAADGSWGAVLTLAASDTIHSNAWVNGKVAVDDSGALTVA